jgi:hypothetical protein
MYIFSHDLLAFEGYLPKGRGEIRRWKKIKARKYEKDGKEEKSAR